MRVYRCVTAREILNKYKKNTNRKKNNLTLNTHIYNPEDEYIHFFRYLDFAKYYFELGKEGSYEEENENYVLFMVVNIPNSILSKYLGFGFYNYSDNVFNFKNNKIPIPEYAIPVNEFTEEYIVYMNNQESIFSLYSRGINEHQEFEKYLELVQKLHPDKFSCQEIADFLTKNNLCELLGVKDDDKSELDLEKEAENKLSLMQFPKDNDIEIEDIGTMILPNTTDWEIGE